MLWNKLASLLSQPKEQETSEVEIREAIAVLRRHGVDTYGSLIPDPSYTKEDWERLWRFVEETGLYYDEQKPKRPSRLAQDPELAVELWEQSERGVAEALSG